MAELTLFSKVLLGGAAVALCGGAAYKLAGPQIKNYLAKQEAQEEEPEAPEPAPVVTSTASNNQAPSGVAEAAPVPAAPKPIAAKINGKALGSPKNPLKVSLVSFHGYGPALFANGGLKTKPGSIFSRRGINVEFILQDDVPALSTIFESNIAQCAWRTSDFWAQEHPNLRNAKHDGKAIMIVDNTQGADAIITNDPGIQSVEDLAGKNVALLKFTPSHGLLLDAIDNSSLSAKKKNTIKSIFINSDEGTVGVRAAFESKNVQAAVLWDPDLSLALRVPGAHTLYSTKLATNLIYDVIVCDQRYLKNAANEATFKAFVAGWFDGIEETNKNRAPTVDALVASETMFDLLAKKESKEFIAKLFDNLLLTGLDDNVRILGLNADDTNHYERVYARFDEIYRQVGGALANPNAPVITPSDSFDYRFVKALLAENPKAKEESEKPQFVFSEAEKNKAVEHVSAVTKPVLVEFASGAWVLTDATKRVIDTELVPVIEENGAGYFLISGNTDSTGNKAKNQDLSEKRAQTVLQYLTKEWDMDPVRFKTVGYGSSKALCTEDAPEEGLSPAKCRARNRTTRISVFAK